MMETMMKMMSKITTGNLGGGKTLGANGTMPTNGEIMTRKAKGQYANSIVTTTVGPVVLILVLI